MARAWLIPFYGAGPHVVHRAPVYVNDAGQDVAYPIPSLRHGPAIVRPNQNPIVIAATVTCTNVIVGTEIRLHVDDGEIRDGFGAEIDGVESAAGSTVVLNYTVTGASVPGLLWVHLPGRAPNRITGFDLTGADLVFPFQQRVDRAYRNP